MHLDNDPDIIIDIKGLTKSFNHKEAVCSLDMQVKAGEIFGFLGPNGSGKTTTIRMLCGLLKPDAGTGTCLGYDIQKQSMDIKNHVGYMTQSFSLYSDLTIRENLEFIARMYRVDSIKKRVAKSLKRLGFDTQQEKKLAQQLSGGWKQRLALAGAMIHAPQLLLLDEPTAGVDPQARREFWNEIHELASQGITVLVSTHYMDEAERCTRLAYIAYGRILAQGNVKEIIDQSHLTVWSVSGQNLAALSKSLQNLQDRNIEQVTPFGVDLHVVGHDEKRLEQAIDPFRRGKNYRWEKIQPSLEDVFISLVAAAQEKLT